MGSLMIKEDVWLVDIPNNKTVAADVIRSGEYIFIKYHKSQFGELPTFSVCRQYKTEKWAFPLSLKSWPWQRHFMDVLVRLKLMSKERRSELIELDNQLQLEQQRKYDIDDLKKLSERYYNLQPELNALVKALEAA